MKRTINQSELEVCFKQDYLSIDKEYALSAEGTFFKVGDIVYHEGKNESETAIINSFSIDEESYDIIAHTDKGYARISFLYH